MSKNTIDQVKAKAYDKAKDYINAQVESSTISEVMLRVNREVALANKAYDKAVNALTNTARAASEAQEAQEALEAVAVAYAEAAAVLYVATEAHVEAEAKSKAIKTLCNKIKVEAYAEAIDENY